MARANRGLVFDLDGTLLDSAPGIKSALEKVRPGRVIDLATVRRLVALDATTLVGVSLGLTGEDTVAALTAFRAIYAKAPCEPSDLYVGVIDGLEYARDRGYRIAVCTNKPQHLADIVVERLGLSTSIEVIVGASTNRPVKPAPDMLLHALESLGLLQPALFVGDTQIDAETAARAGVPFVAALFGYGRFDAQTERVAELKTFGDLQTVIDERH